LDLYLLNNGLAGISNPELGLYHLYLMGHIIHFKLELDTDFDLSDHYNNPELILEHNFIRCIRVLLLELGLVMWFLGHKLALKPTQEVLMCFTRHKLGLVHYMQVLNTAADLSPHRTFSLFIIIFKGFN